MFRLALRSLRFRTGGFVAGFASMFLGAVILMAFASMLDTGAGPGVSATDEETLTTMATVVGGWGLIIVVFAVASTLTLSVRQRASEMALLKSIGATPGQVGRMIAGEAAVLAVLAAAVAIPPAMLAGRLVFELLQDSGQVGPAVSHRFGGVAIAMGIGITLVASTIAALLTARRATRMRAADAMLEAAIEQPRMSRKRIVAACLFLAAGINCGVITATVMHGKGSDAMQTAGQASIWFSIGLALFAPALVRGVTRVLAGPVQRLGVSGYLTLQNVRGRAHQMAGAVMPIILFTGIATGTIYMQSIENAASAGLVKTNEQSNVETLNFVVVGMIAVFAAIMLINTLVAATIHRRREFGQQRLVGSTPPQVVRMVSMESVVLAATGILFGSFASIVTVVPYSIARTDSILPDSTIAIYLGIVTVAAALTLAASLGATRRAISMPAVQAAAA
jgi:predicted lysophospholipase L1 biosynthesis ABC-type transport system permease subunit